MCAGIVWSDGWTSTAGSRRHRPRESSMSRDWAAIYTAMLVKPKYRRLSLPARAGLFHTWLMAGSQHPEATWRNRDELAEMLELDGFPPDVLEELLARRWLDTDDAGRVVIHNWDQWQLAASDASRRVYERDRKQEWRRKRRHDAEEADPLSPAPLSPVQEQDSTGTQQDRTEQESPTVPDAPGHVPKARSVDLSSCPRCGDRPLIDSDTINVTRVNRSGQLAHLPGRCHEDVAVVPVSASRARAGAPDQAAPAGVRG